MVKLVLVLAFILSAANGHRISISDILTNTEDKQKSYDEFDPSQLATDIQQQYKSSGMDVDDSPISQSTMLHIANECKTPSIHKIVEDHVFMALFENIDSGCTEIQGIWDIIPSVAEESDFNELVNNISYAIQNKSFNESVNYGIPDAVIKNIATWLEPGLEVFHPDLPYDVSYHIYRWLLQRKYTDDDYFTDKCDFVNNDPVDVFFNIEATLEPVRDCMTREIVHHGVDEPDIQLNCSKVNRWNKNFVLALEFNIQLSFILGVNAGVGIGVELKTIAGGQLYWKAGGGLSLFFGFNMGIAIPFVAELKYLNGGTIKIGGGIAIGITIEAHVLLSSQKFEYIGYEGDFGLGLTVPVNINIEYVYRHAIKQFMVNLTAICSSKTFRPSGHPTFRPNNHPTLRPNNHPTHKPIKVPARDPAHPTPGPNHPTFRPPERERGAKGKGYNGQREQAGHEPHGRHSGSADRHRKYNEHGAHYGDVGN